MTTSLESLHLLGETGLRRIMHQAPVAMAIVLGPDFIVHLANAQQLDLWQKTQDEVLGKPLFTIFPEVATQGLRERLSGVFTTGVAFKADEMEVAFVRGGQLQQAWFDFIYEPMRNDLGQVEGVMVVSTEVTEKVTARRKLEEKREEHKYRSLFLQMNRGFCIVEMLFDGERPVDYRFLEYNERFEEQTGLKDALGKTARTLLPGLEEHWFQIYGNVATTGIPHSFVEHAETMGRWFEVNAYKLGEADSRTVAILFSDITERKRHEEQLREATQEQQRTLSMLRSLLANAPVGFAFTDSDNRFTHVNEPLATINGHTPEAHIGKRIRDLLPEAGALIEGYLEQVRQTGKAVAQIDLQGITPSQPGVMRHFLAAYYPVFGSEPGFVEQVGAVVTEVTEQKRAEEKIRESEKRYYDIYNRAPVSIWEEDFTELRRRVLLLRQQGVTDMRAYFSTRKDELRALIGTIRFIDVNLATLELYGGTKEQLLQNLSGFFIEETLEAFLDELQVIASGGGRYEVETVVGTHDGGKVNVLVRIDFPYDDDYSNIHVILLDITARKQAELAIRESEERFRHLADNAPVMIWITDGDGYCHYLNKQWYDYTGQSIEEGLGIGWSNAVHPEESARAAQVFLDSSNSQSPYRIEFRLRKWDGSYRWVIDSAVPRRDADGNFLGYIGSVVDIHDQKLAEEQLRKLHSHLDLATQSAGVGTWSYDLQSGLLEWSDLHKKMWGYDPEGGPLPFEAWYRTIVPEDQATAVERVAAASRNHTDYVNDYRICRAGDGAIRWMHSFGRFLPNSQGAPTVLTGITIDITEAKQVESELRESEARFRNLADNAPMWVWLSDAAGVVTYANRQLLDYMGAEDVDGIAGNKWEQAIHPDDLGPLTDIYTNAVRTYTPYIYEARVRNKTNGQYEWFQLRGVPRLKNGGYRGIIGTGINIHANKQFTEELERMVRERTTALERSNNELRQFAHVASHDLKEPVRKVLTFQSRILHEFGGELPGKVHDYLGRIEKAALRSNAMIEGLLRSTAVQSDEEALHPVNLNRLLEDVADDVDLLIERSQATLRIAVLPEVPGRKTLLHHLFYNLLLNALKFSRPGVPTQIDITGESFEKDGRPFLRILVRDNGIGFLPEQADQIFQPFKRLHSKDEFEGAGLGLAFCREVALRHGGCIRAEAGEGAGATFVLELPAALPPGEQ